MGILLEILQYHNINFTFASGGIWSSSRSLSIIGEKVHFTYTFYWWKKSVSLSLSIGKKWPTQLHSLSLMVKYDLPYFHFLWVKYGPDNYFYFHQSWNMNSLQHYGFHSPLSQVRCKGFLTVYRCTSTDFSLWRFCVYQCWLLVVIDDSLGRVGHESQNLRMWFSEHVMVRKDHNVVIFNLANPLLWEEEFSHNKLMHKVQMYMSCFWSVLLTHIYRYSFAMQGDTPINTNFSCWSVLVKYIVTKGSMVKILIALGRQTNKGQAWSSCL